MGSESEQCVDELLRKLALIDETIEQLQDHNEELLNKGRTILTEAQQFIDQNKSAIPGYSLKKISDSLRKLDVALNVAQKSKLKFKFNVKPADSSTSKPYSAPLDIILKQDEEKNPTATPVFIGFKNVHNQKLNLCSEEVDAKDVSLVELEKCDIKINGVANTVYIHNLKECKVEILLACRAISVINCIECEFRLVCQQLRIDSTSMSSFELFTSAGSMLESSKELKFKKLTTNECDEELFKKANFDKSKNNWDNINDFDCLSPNSPSKNYSLIKV